MPWAKISAAIDQGTDRARKTLLRALVHEVRADGHDHIKPVFRVPFTRPEDTVRTLVDSCSGSTRCCASWRR
jgi:hypothetical protein